MLILVGLSVVTASLLTANAAAAIQDLSPANVEAATTAASGHSSIADPLPLTADNAERFLDDFFADEAIAPLLQGAVVSIVKDGRVLLERGYGFADKAHTTLVSPDTTLFRVASLSKTFTAIAIMQLAEKQMLDLHTDISRYLPGLALDNPFDEAVTIAHLLTHTSGFAVRDPLTSELHHDFTSVTSIEDYVKANLPAVIRKPGQAYMYDNFAYALLGLIVEKTSSLPFEQYMERYIFLPLGMTQTRFTLDDSALAALADSYTDDGSLIEPYTLTPTIMPQGGLLTTASDMSRFMLAFLNEGRLSKQRILSPDSIAAMSLYRDYTHPNLPNTTYGFEAGYQLPAAGSSNRVLAKTGDLVGFSSYLWLIPDADTGVFISYTNNSSLRQQLYTDFLRTFYPALTKPVIDLRKHSTTGDLSVYNGLYGDLRLPGLVHSVQAEGRYRLNLSNALSGSQTLQLAGKDLFVDETGRLVAFVRDEDKQVRYLRDALANPLGYAQRYPDARGFSDVASDLAQAQAIYALQSFGLYDNDVPGTRFYPEQAETRAAFVHNLLHVLHLPIIEAPDLFADLKGHALAESVQAAAHYGLIVGNASGWFEPDRAITRQEAAAILHRFCSTQRATDAFGNIAIVDPLDAWALPGAQMIIALGLSEATYANDRAGYVYRGKQPLLRAEAALLYYRLLTERLLDRLPLRENDRLQQPGAKLEAIRE